MQYKSFINASNSHNQANIKTCMSLYYKCKSPSYCFILKIFMNIFHFMNYFSSLMPVLLERNEDFMGL